jgi:hypothetical protein
VCWLIGVLIGVTNGAGLLMLRLLLLLLLVIVVSDAAWGSVGRSLRGVRI